MRKCRCWQQNPWPDFDIDEQYNYAESWKGCQFNLCAFWTWFWKSDTNPEPKRKRKLLLSWQHLTAQVQMLLKTELMRLIKMELLRTTTFLHHGCSLNTKRTVRVHPTSLYFWYSSGSNFESKQPTFRITSRTRSFTNLHFSYEYITNGRKKSPKMELRCRVPAAALKHVFDTLTNDN